MSDISSGGGGGGWGEEEDSKSWLESIIGVLGGLGSGSRGGAQAEGVTQVVQGIGEIGEIEYARDEAYQASIADFIAEEKKKYYEQQYLANLEAQGYVAGQPPSVETGIEELSLGRYLKYNQEDFTKETTKNRFISQHPEAVNPNYVTKDEAQKALEAYRELPIEQQYDPTSYELNYDNTDQGLVFRGISAPKDPFAGITVPIENFEELKENPTEYKAAKERQQDFQEILDALNTGDVERVDDWADLSRQLLNFYAYFSMYSDVKERIDASAEGQYEEFPDLQQDFAERVLRAEFESKDVEYNDDLIKGLLELEDPSSTKRALEVIMYNYADPLRPHVATWLGTNDEEVLNEYLNKPLSKGEKLKNFGGKLVGELYSTPVLGDFLEWIDRPSQAVFMAGAGLFGGVENLLKGDFKAAGGALLEGIEGSSNELGLFATGNNEFGLFDKDLESAFDLNEDSYIDIFEVFGTENTYGVMGDIANIVVAAVTDPLMGAGVGNRFSRNVLKNIATESLSDTSAIVRAATKLGINEPSIVGKGFKSAMINLKTDGWKALTATERKMIERVVREQIEIAYEQFPKTRRVQGAIARNARGINAIENDLRIVLKQLERGGRDGFRYYGKTLIPASGVRSAVNRFAAANAGNRLGKYQAKPTSRSDFIVHPDGSVTELPPFMKDQPTLFDEAAEFGEDMVHDYNVLAKEQLTPEQYQIYKDSQVFYTDKEAFERAAIHTGMDPDLTPTTLKGSDSYNFDVYEDYFPVYSMGYGDAPTPWAQGTPTPTANQISWFNSMVGLQWIKYDFYFPLTGKQKITEKAAGTAKGIEKTEEFYQGQLFKVTDEISDDIPRPYGMGSANEFDSTVSKIQGEASAAGQMELPFQKTADDLARYLSNEVIFPPTAAGQAAKAAYLQELVQTVNAPIMRLVMEKMPSLSQMFFYQKGLISSLRHSFSPRFEIAQKLGKEASDDIRTAMVRVDQRAALKFQQWADRVFRVDTFGGTSLAMRAKQAWEGLPEQIVKGQTVARSFEIGPKSLIGQFTSSKTERDLLLREFPAGTDVGDWLRAFDELRDAIWDMIPKKLKEAAELDRYAYTPRVSSQVFNNLSDLPARERLARFLKDEIVGIPPKDQTVLAKWVKGIEDTFGSQFVNSQYFQNLIIKVSKQFAKDVEGAGRAATSVGDVFTKQRSIAPEIQDLIMVNKEFRDYIVKVFSDDLATMRNVTGFQWADEMEGVVKLAKDPEKLTDLFSTNYLDAWTVRTKAAYNAHMMSDYLGELLNVTDEIGHPVARKMTLNQKQMDDIAETGMTGGMDDTGQYFLGQGRDDQFVGPFGTVQPEYVPLRNADGRVVKDFMEDNSMIFVRKEVADDAIKIFDLLQNTESQQALKAIVQTQSDRWARFALLSPAFITRNAQSNMLLAYLGGLRNPAHVITSMKLQKLRTEARLLQRQTGKDLDEIYEEFVATGRMSSTDVELLKELNTYGVYNTQADDIFSTVDLGKYNITKLARSVNSAVENNARGALFLSGRAQGMDAATSSINTRKYLFDYKDLTPAEQAIRDRFSRFYTFFRKNTSVQIGAALTMPARVASAARIEKAFTDNMTEWFLGEQPTKEGESRTPLPYWAVMAGMRDYNGTLIGMDAPLTSAYQTLSAITGVPVLAYQGLRWLSEKNLPKTDISFNDLPQVNNFWAFSDPIMNMFGADRDMAERLRNTVGLFSGWGPNIIMTTANLVSGVNWFTRGKIDTPSETFGQISNIFNPAIARVMTYQKHLTSNRDAMLNVMNILGGFRVYDPEKLEGSQYYALSNILNQVKKELPEEMRPSPEEVRALGYLEAQSSLWSDLVYGRFIDYDDDGKVDVVPPEEFWPTLMEKIGLWTPEEGEYAHSNYFTKIGDNLDLTTPAGRDALERQTQILGRQIADLMVAWHQMPEDIAARDILFPNLETLNMLDPTLIYRMAMAAQSLPTQEAAWQTQDDLFMKNAFIEEGEPPTGSAAIGAAMAVEVGLELTGASPETIEGIKTMYPVTNTVKMYLDMADNAIAEGIITKEDKRNWLLENIAANTQLIIYNSLQALSEQEVGITGQALGFVQGFEKQYKVDNQVELLSFEEVEAMLERGRKTHMFTIMMIMDSLNQPLTEKERQIILESVMASESGLGADYLLAYDMISDETWNRIRTNSGLTVDADQKSRNIYNQWQNAETMKDATEAVLAKNRFAMDSPLN
tara:strand:- start:12006 stop:18614 length:6609 start_codon:yes stop_codon:yes gene_type:complete